MQKPTGKEPSQTQRRAHSGSGPMLFNQKDILERNSQVQLMKEIFSEAELVISWLGNGEEKVELAMETFRTIATEMKDRYDSPSDIWLGRGDISLNIHWMEKYPFLCLGNNDGFLGNKAWDSVLNFFNLAYWKRVWIFQEVVLGTQVL
jgi:hypothetical protein